MRIKGENGYNGALKMKKGLHTGKVILLQNYVRNKRDDYSCIQTLLRWYKDERERRGGERC